MLAELANRMAAAGHAVTIVMPSNGLVEYTMGCTIIVLPRTRLLADDFPPADVIVSNFYTTVPVCEEASRQGKGVHVRLSLCYEPSFLPDNNRSFASYHLTPNLLVLSKWQRDVVKLNHGVEGRIVPVGVDIAFHDMNMRHKRGGKFIVSAIVRKIEGGFSGHREQDYLLEQLGAIKAQYPGVTVYIITPPGEYAESVYLMDLQRDPRFEMRTPASDAELNYYYNETDIFVSSSTYDTGSLPGLEAMRCGAALATIYSGGNMEYCRPGINCLMSYRYENRLAQDIGRLITDDDLRHRLAVAGAADSLPYTWERSAAMFEQELCRILGI